MLVTSTDEQVRMKVQCLIRYDYIVVPGSSIRHSRHAGYSTVNNGALGSVSTN